MLESLIVAMFCMNWLTLVIITNIRIALFTVVAQDIVNIAHPGQNFELMCDVSGTESETNWRINGSSLISLNDLSDVLIPGHTISGRNIVVENIMMNDVRNGSRYQCIVLAISITPGNLTILYVAGECNDQFYVCL